MNAQPATAMSLGLAGCEVCGLVSRPLAGQPPHCPRCGERLHFRRPASIERCWALVIAALILYLPANLLPVLTTHTPEASQTSRETNDASAGVTLQTSVNARPSVQPRRAASMTT